MHQNAKFVKIFLKKEKSHPVGHMRRVLTLERIETPLAKTFFRPAGVVFTLFLSFQESCSTSLLSRV